MAKSSGKVDKELVALDVLLATDDLTPKQRLALLVAKGALKWMVGLAKQNGPPPPSQMIMKTVATPVE